MERKKRSEKIKLLKQDGFKSITGFSSLYINSHGKVCNIKTGKYINSTKKNYIKYENNYLSVPKLILQTFKNETYRNGQTQYIDGNTNNLTPENLKYTRLFAPHIKTDPVNPESLLTVIRCYYQLPKGFNINDNLLKKYYLKHICEKRGFLIINYNTPYIKIFSTYLSENSKPENGFIIDNISISDTAKKYGLTVRDCSIIINQFINQLTNEILHDLKKGFLSIYEYLPKPLTPTQIIRQYNKELISRGKKPLRLRKKSVKEKLRDFKKHINNLNKQANQRE